MTQWLIRRFIKNADQVQSPVVRAAYGTLGSIVGVVVNLLLAALKFVLGTLTGSLAVTADAANNLSDAGASIVALVSVRIAQKPLDKEHPFGHGRMEYLGTLGVGALIVLMGVELLKTSVESILHPAALSLSAVSLAALGLSILLKVWLFFYYRTLGRATQNSTLLAASKDSISDVLATGAVVLALVLQLVFGWQIDGWIGLLVALLVLKAGISVCKDTVDRLLGAQPDPEKVARLHELLLARPGVLGVHDLVINDYGPGRSIASAHVEVDARGDILQIHEMVDEAEREIGAELGMMLCIHMDPIVTDDPETNAIKEKMQRFLKEMDERITLHDFRRVPGQNKISLIFDCLLPADYKDRKALLSAIQGFAHGQDERYAVIVQFDSDFT